MMQITADISAETIRNDTFAACPFRNGEFGICQAVPEGMECCVWDADSGFLGEYNLNPLCPLLKGDVVVRGKR